MEEKRTKVASATGAVPAAVMNFVTAAVAVAATMDLPDTTGVAEAVTRSVVVLPRAEVAEGVTSVALLPGAVTGPAAEAEAVRTGAAVVGVLLPAVAGVTAVILLSTFFCHN